MITNVKKTLYFELSEPEREALAVAKSILREMLDEMDYEEINRGVEIKNSLIIRGEQLEDLIDFFTDLTV